MSKLHMPPYQGEQQSSHSLSCHVLAPGICAQSTPATDHCILWEILWTRHLSSGWGRQCDGVEDTGLWSLSGDAVCTCLKPILLISKKIKCVTYFSGCSEDWSMNSFIYLIIYSFTYYALCTYYLPDFVLDSKDRKRQNACPQSLWPCTYREKWTVLKTGCLFLICKSPFWVHGVSARRNMIRLIFPKGHLAAVFRLRDRPARVTLMRSVWRKLQESRCKIKWLGLRWQQQRWQEGDQNKGEKPVREAQREHMWNA